MRYVMRAFVVLLPMLSGCILGNRPQIFRGGSNAKELTYYLDGAGNLGYGVETVPLGLADGGYRGKVEHYIWSTYLGPVMDQISYRHNRSEGRELANRIRKHLDKYPDAQVNLIGLSAGTGVVVFALESLPPQYQVDNVIMLSSSLSADYDLSLALRRVRGGMYFFHSSGDPILRSVVPFTGTVDRESTSEVAGVVGARLPRSAGPATRELYVELVHNIRWTSTRIGPIQLRHAGTTDRGFIREAVAPIIVRRSSGNMLAAPAPAERPPGTLLPPKPATQPARAPASTPHSDGKLLP